MIRKILTTVLCVLLVMALPLSALAATQHTLSIIPGDEMASVDAVTDLFKTLSFRLTTDEDAAAIGIAMDDTDVLTAAMRSDENGVYVQSDSLADGVLYFTWDEIFDAALTSMKELDADEEDTQAVQQALDQAKQQFVTALSTASSLSVSEAKTPEEGMAAVKEMFKDDPVMVSFVEDIYNRMKQTEGEFTSAAHDPATLKMELSITADDYVKICDSKYMRNILETAAEQEFPDATAGEKAAKVDELIAKMKEMYSKSEINIPITILTAEEGNTLISMEMPMVPTKPDEPDTPVIPGALPFVDVNTNDWFYEDVAYVYAQGLMTGSTATAFAPNDAMTRAMVWTVLGRMSGENVEGGTPWYALAQSWAVSSNVSDGTGPNDSITREQLVTMLYRQAGSPEVGVSELALLGRFTDGESVSSWAEEAMAWAVAQGVLTGDGDLLNPQATATRAQVAAILARFCENIQK